MLQVINVGIPSEREKQSRDTRRKEDRARGREKGDDEKDGSWYRHRRGGKRKRKAARETAREFPCSLDRHDEEESEQDRRAQDNRHDCDQDNEAGTQGALAHGSVAVSDIWAGCSPPKRRSRR